jgi:hypothetical protein
MALQDIITGSYTFLREGTGTGPNQDNSAAPLPNYGTLYSKAPGQLGDVDGTPVIIGGQVIEATHRGLFVNLPGPVKNGDVLVDGTAYYRVTAVLKRRAMGSIPEYYRIFFVQFQP